jgi:hypothetical protein
MTRLEGFRWPSNAVIERAIGDSLDAVGVTTRTSVLLNDSKQEDQMIRQRRHDDDDDGVFDANGLLRDKRSFRVPMTAMDSLSRSVFEHYGRMTDASGDGGIALNKPGYRISDDYRPSQRQKVYDDYENELQNAWRNPPTGAGETEFRGAKPGDSCTINGAPGVLRKIESKLVCVPISKDAMHDAREQAYLDYQNRIENAWRDGP